MSASGSPPSPGGGQLPAGGVPPVTPGGVPVTPGAASGPVGNVTSVNVVPVSYDDAGDVLQASTTVTSLAVALTVLFPSTSLAKMTLITIGHWSLSLGPTVLMCGVCALMSSIWSLDHLRRKAGLTGRTMITSHIGLLFLALFLFVLIYLGVALSYVF